MSNVHLDPLASIEEGGILIHHSNTDQLDLFASSDQDFDPEFDCSVEIEWSAEELRTLQDHLLSSSFAIFADTRTTEESRSEIIEWVLDDSKFPFSFITCCSSMGLNHEDLREKFLHLLKKLKK